MVWIGGLEVQTPKPPNRQTKPRLGGYPVWKSQWRHGTDQALLPKEPGNHLEPRLHVVARKGKTKGQKVGFEQVSYTWSLILTLKTRGDPFISGY